MRSHLIHVLFVAGLKGAALTPVYALCPFKVEEKTSLDFSLYAESHTVSTLCNFPAPNGHSMFDLSLLY